MSVDDNHENWIRYNCLELAVKTHRFSTPEKQIETARKYKNFVLGISTAEILDMKKHDNENT